MRRVTRNTNFAKFLLSMVSSNLLKSNAGAGILLKLLVSLEVLLVIVYLTGAWTQEPDSFVNTWFNLSGEQTVPATFSSIQLLGLGLILLQLAISYFVVRGSRHPSLVFFILGVLFVFLGLDEGFGIHEALQKSYRRGEFERMIPRINWFIPSVNNDHGVWMSIYILIGALLLLALFYPLKRLRQEFPKPTFLMGLGLFVFVMGAAGMEIVAYVYFWGGDANRAFGNEMAGILRNLQYSLEEFLEMIGISLTVYGVLIIRFSRIELPSNMKGEAKLYVLNNRWAFTTTVVGLNLALFSILVDPLRGHQVHMSLSQIIAFFVGSITALVEPTMLLHRIKSNPKLEPL